MEQNNLIVTPDGKSWDEVTRDVSYIGNACVRAGVDGGDIATGGSSAWVVHDSWRSGGAGRNWHNKDFAIAYDRIICLKDGDYNMFLNSATSGSGQAGRMDLYINGSQVLYSASTDPESGRKGSVVFSISTTLIRGDYIQLNALSIEGGTGYQGTDYHYSFDITRSN